MTPATRSNPPPTRAAVVAAALVVGVYLAVAVPLMFADQPGRAASDEADFHRPAVEQFARQWPRPDVADYRSATTPGYHLVLAPIRRYLTADVHFLRLAGSLFTVGLLATLAAAVARGAGAATAVALCLPVVGSLYVLSAGVWLLPDNAGWWGVLAVLLIALRPRVDAWTYLAGGLVLLALVLFRQIHLWAAVPLLVAAFIGVPGSLPLAAHRSGPARVVYAALAVLPSLVALALFFHLWHGTLPPAVRHLNAGANPAVPAMALAVFGTVGMFYLGFLVPRRDDLRRCWPWLALGAVVGASAGLVPATDYDFAAGRRSGLWNVACLLPTFAHRSPVIVILATVGGAVLAAWALALPRRERWIFLAAWLAFTAAHTATHEAFQRYYEPMALILLALAAARLSALDRSGDGPPRWALAGPVVLAAGLALVTALSLR